MPSSSSSSSKRNKSSNPKKRLLIIVLSLILACCVFFFWDGYVAEDIEPEEDVAKAKVYIRKDDNNDNGVGTKPQQQQQQQQQQQVDVDVDVDTEIEQQQQQQQNDSDNEQEEEEQQEQEEEEEEELQQEELEEQEANNEQQEEEEEQQEQEEEEELEQAFEEQEEELEQAFEEQEEELEQEENNEQQQQQQQEEEEEQENEQEEEAKDNEQEENWEQEEQDQNDNTNNNDNNNEQEEEEEDEQQEVEENGNDSDGNDSNDNNDDNKNNSKTCSDACKLQRNARIQAYGTRKQKYNEDDNDNDDDGLDIMNRSDLLKLVQLEKQKLLNKLYIDYGNENFHAMFVKDINDDDDREGEERTRRQLDNEDNHVERRQEEQQEEEFKFRIYEPIEETSSLEAFKRRMLIKLLKVQVSRIQKEMEITGCDCWNNDDDDNESTLLSNDNNNLQDLLLKEDTIVYEPYIWATGGHSSSAGHGNNYNESYTAVMERDLQPFFQPFGIDFKARNHAMGGTSSGYEISSCFEQVFGTDLDIFSWDYGMVDQRSYGRLAHYGYRGYHSPGHPSFIGIRLEDSTRYATMKAFGKFLKIPVFTNAYLGKIRKAIPDTEGLSDAEIQQMPEFVRNFKCSGKIEQGDPYCEDEKWSKVGCSTRFKKTSWHPGFKSHALDGHVLALTLVEAFIEALHDLSQHDIQNPQELLALLQRQEEENIEFFKNAPLPKGNTTDLIDASVKEKLRQHYNNNNGGGDNNVDVLETFFRGPSMCRTARLPAQSRYLGYMTDSGKKGGIAVVGFEEYDTGIPKHVAKETANESNEYMRLAYDALDERERYYPCNDTIVKPDYKDFYYIHANDGWVKTIFPNPAEKEAYNFEPSKFIGLLAIHLVMCDWGNCPGGDIREDAIETGKLEIKVNGKKVTSFINLDALLFLVGEEEGGGGENGENNSNNNGLIWKLDEEMGHYEISVRVNEPDSYFRISGFIMY